MVKMDYTLEQDLEEPVPHNGTVSHLVFLGGLYLGGLGGCYWVCSIVCEQRVGGS